MTKKSEELEYEKRMQIIKGIMEVASNASPALQSSSQAGKSVLDSLLDQTHQNIDHKFNAWLNRIKRLEGALSQSGHPPAIEAIAGPTLIKHWKQQLLQLLEEAGAKEIKEMDFRKNKPLQMLVLSRVFDAYNRAQNPTEKLVEMDLAALHEFDYKAIVDGRAEFSEKYKSFGRFFRKEYQKELVALVNTDKRFRNEIQARQQEAGLPVYKEMDAYIEKLKKAKQEIDEIKQLMVQGIRDGCLLMAEQIQKLERQFQEMKVTPELNREIQVLGLADLKEELLSPEEIKNWRKELELGLDDAQLSAATDVSLSQWKERLHADGDFAQVFALANERFDSLKRMTRLARVVDVARRMENHAFGDYELYTNKILKLPEEINSLNVYIKTSGADDKSKEIINKIHLNLVKMREDWKIRNRAMFLSKEKDDWSEEKIRHEFINFLDYNKAMATFVQDNLKVARKVVCDSDEVVHNHSAKIRALSYQMRDLNDSIQKSQASSESKKAVQQLRTKMWGYFNKLKSVIAKGLGGDIKPIEQEIKKLRKDAEKSVEAMSKNLDDAREIVVLSRSRATASHDPIHVKFEGMPEKDYQTLIAQLDLLEAIRHSLSDEVPFWHDQQLWGGSKIRMWDTHHTQSEELSVPDGIAKIVNEVIESKKYTVQQKLEEIQKIAQVRLNEKEGKRPSKRNLATHDFYQIMRNIKVNSAHAMHALSNKVQYFVQDHQKSKAKGLRRHPVKLFTVVRGQSEEQAPKHQPKPGRHVHTRK